MTVAGNTGRILRTAAGSAFVPLLVFAPLNFGSTRAGGAAIIAAVCAAATLLWTASLVIGRRRPSVPVVAAVAAAVFVVCALPWIGGLNQATPVMPFTETHFTRVTDRWPFSVLANTRADSLALTVALVAAILPLIDLSRDRVWALAFAITIVATAVVVALLAVLQNHTGATGIYWRADGRMPGTFCGTFFHHTSAGAYFNTAWPLAVALTWIARTRHRVLAVAGVFSVIVLIAAHGSHVSRFPQVAALLVAPVLLLGLKIRFRGLVPWLCGTAAVAALGVLVFIGGRTGAIGARWSALVHPVAVVAIQPPESAWAGLLRDDLLIPGTSHPGWFGDRLVAWRAAASAIGAKPLAGHGPGNWMGAASHHSDDPFVRTFYQFLQFTHQDPLQTAVEWGIPAALALWTLLVGALVAVVRAPRPLSLAAACALAAVLLQAQLDFPLQIPAIALNAVVLAALGWSSLRPLSA
jgi:O-antigen ligase